MKKILIVLLVLVILLTALFFWKGGHHMIHIDRVLSEWLDADKADNTITLQLPGLEMEQDSRRSEDMDEPLPLTADFFWTEYGDEPLYGLTIQELTTWTDGKNMYLETGNAYRMPNFSALKRPTRKLMVMSMLLFGRVTRDADTYNISMKCGELEVNVDVIADDSLEEINASIQLPDGTDIGGSLVTERRESHPIPEEVADAIVLAEMEPPAPLGEPIAILFPAFKNLLPFRGELTLSVEGNIDEVAETMDFTMDSETIELEQGDEIITVDLPAEVAGVDPTLLGLLILQYGTFDNDGDSAEFEIKLEEEATTMLCNTLAPQIEDSGITFSESEITLTIEDGMVTSVTLTADGEVDMVFESTPVYFSAEVNAS